MTTEGWICPICHAGVAPSCVRCPCAYSAAELLKGARPPMTPILGERRLDEYRPVKSFHDQCAGQAMPPLTEKQKRDQADVVAMMCGAAVL